MGQHFVILNSCFSGTHSFKSTCKMHMCVLEKHTARFKSSSSSWASTLMAPHIAIALNEYRSPGRKDHKEDFFVCEYMYTYLHHNLSVHCAKQGIIVVDALSKLNCKYSAIRKKLDKIKCSKHIRKNVLLVQSFYYTFHCAWLVMIRRNNIKHILRHIA